MLKSLQGRLTLLFTAFVLLVMVSVGATLNSMYVQGFPALRSNRYAARINSTLLTTLPGSFALRNKLNSMGLENLKSSRRCPVCMERP